MTSGRLRAALSDAVIGARFVGDLPAYLRRPAINGAEARAVLQRRLGSRAADLMDLMSRAMN